MAPSEPLPKGAHLFSHTFTAPSGKALNYLKAIAATFRVRMTVTSQLSGNTVTFSTSYPNNQILTDNFPLAERQQVSDNMALRIRQELVPLLKSWDNSQLSKLTVLFDKVLPFMGSYDFEDQFELKTLKEITIKQEQDKQWSNKSPQEVSSTEPKQVKKE